MMMRVTSYVKDDACHTYAFGASQPILIGRMNSADVVIEDPSVSREHARITATPSGWLIEDLGSKNGTRMNGNLVTSAVTNDHQIWLSVGGALIKLDISSEQAIIDQPKSDRRNAISGLRERSTLTEAINACLDAAIQLTECERASVWTVGDDKSFSLRARLGPAMPPESVGAMSKALFERKPVLENDVSGVEALAARESILASGIRALICAPLYFDNRILGILYADSQKVGKVFSAIDKELFDNLAEQAGICLGAMNIAASIDRAFDDTQRT